MVSPYEWMKPTTPVFVNDGNKKVQWPATIVASPYFDNSLNDWRVQIRWDGNRRRIFVSCTDCTPIIIIDEDQAVRRTSKRKKITAATTTTTTTTTTTITTTRETRKTTRRKATTRAVPHQKQSSKAKIEDQDEEADQLTIESEIYPVVLDANETVLSLPPIINGAHSKITIDTKNVFIECTATDLTKANIVLDTVVCMFSEYCAKPFTVEPVQVTYVDEAGATVNQYVSPKIEMRKETARVDFVNSMIGIDIAAENMVKLCDKLQLGPARLLGEDNMTLEVTVPPTRSDILHAVDIAEDIGIAYGYNNIVKRVPHTCTVGREQPLNQISDLLREEVS